MSQSKQLNKEINFFMFELLCRKSSEEATKERQTFFNLLQDAQVLLVDIQYFVKETRLYQCCYPVIFFKSFVKKLMSLCQAGSSRN